MTGMNKLDEARQPGLPGIVLSSDGLGVSVAQRELLAWLRDDFERGLSSQGCEAAAVEIERLLADHARVLAFQQASYERELEADVAIERERWEKAMRLTWNLIKPLRPPVTGTGGYARGFDEGVATALKALRDAIDA